MAEPWIRVHANLATKPVVLRIVDQLGVHENEAVGLLVRFWGQMSQHGANGSVSALSDTEIERWAGWRGKRGIFAAFVRANHTDAQGRVREWDDYAGKLEVRREKEREKKRRQRSVSPGTTTGTATGQAGDVPIDSVPARAVRNETIRDDTRTTSTSAAAARESAFAAQLDTDADRDALASVLANASSAEACLASLMAMAQGMDLPRTPTAGQLGKALRDYAANGERWNAALFRGYVGRAMTPRPANGKAATVGEMTYNAALRATEEP